MEDSTVCQEIADGQGMLLRQAARRFPSNRKNRPVTLSCILRWIIDGVLDSTGDRVKLEAARCAGKWLTTPGAIERFLARQTPSLQKANPIPSAPTARRHASERAARELRRLGI